MTNRREFICAAALAASSATLLGRAPQSMAADRNSRPAPLTQLLWKYFPSQHPDSQPAELPSKVIVIGAGSAGLTAARVLHDAGIPTVVLEGRQRMGGRTWTVDLEGVPVDMNGGYLHDLDVNRLAHLYDEAGWPYDDTELFDIHSNGYDATTGDELGIFGKLRLAYHLNRYFKGPNVPPGTPAADYPLELWTHKYFKDADLSGSSGRLIESLIRTRQSTDGSQMSTYWQGKAGKEGGKWVFPRGGFRPLVTALAQGLDVRLDRVVTRIELAGNKILVGTQQEEHEASHVIVTVPLGVLQARRIDFRPLLPADKLAAIDDTGFANMEKFAILLDRSLEMTDFTTRVFYDAGTGCRLTFVNFSQRVGKPVLVAYAHTDYVAKFIRYNREAREAIMLNALRAMVGQPRLKPKLIVQSDWTNDPNSMGAYSFIKVHGGPQLMNTMARPEYEGRLLFAGEATDFDRFAYVDGAVATGVREARRLLGNKLVLTAAA